MKWKRPEQARYHVDHVIGPAGGNGMHVGLLPTSGDKVEKVHGVDSDPIFTPRNARAYGGFVGERYDPRTGDAPDSWEFARPAAGTQSDPPGTPDRKNDWVLVLDDAARDFGVPGAPPTG